MLLRMTDEELDGVIAHELAHIKHRDTLISTIAATIAGVLAFLAQWAFFLGIGRREGGLDVVGAMRQLGRCRISVATLAQPGASFEHRRLGQHHRHGDAGHRRLPAG